MYLTNKVGWQHGFWKSSQIRKAFPGLIINIQQRSHPSQQQVQSIVSQSLLVFRIIISNNCHHHVADALNCMKFEGRDNWSQFSIWWMCLTRSKYVNWCDIIIVYLPITLIIALILGLVLGLK